jgi:hypothetical protein
MMVDPVPYKLNLLLLHSQPKSVDIPSSQTLLLFRSLRKQPTHFLPQSLELQDPVFSLLPTPSQTRTVLS